MISEPRWAIRLVTRANASRPLSVNSIVTMGSWVFWSMFCSGFLMSEPDSSESSSSTKKRCTESGWLGARSASITTMPCGTFSTWLPGRAGRCRAWRLGWSSDAGSAVADRHLRPAPRRTRCPSGCRRRSRGGPRIALEVRQQLLAAGVRAGDQPLVGTEQVVLGPWRCRCWRSACSVRQRALGLRPAGCRSPRPWAWTSRPAPPPGTAPSSPRTARRGRGRPSTLGSQS